ncbi:hypothetical protein LSH36_44g01056 [Paralvinella palmiformis]|uniref:Uncharacterized protein n=1 Tax=Paralvinella palmiformis TaxID=53620 RepID=A0AAD9K6I2_9ANNE|nr:hypothetical protein LSH36_44g01056 [Paralvinella palmiformis]
MALPVLLYIPNIIGYFRLLLMALSWLTYYDKPMMSFILYSVSLFLDFIWYIQIVLRFDVCIDVIGRGMLWSRLCDFGYLVACLEWLCFVCTHQLGSSWKSVSLQEPQLVKAVMANSRALCAVVEVSMYVKILFDTTTLPDIRLCNVVIIGSHMIWFIWSHIKYLISPEVNKSLNDNLK